MTTDNIPMKVNTQTLSSTVKSIIISKQLDGVCGECIEVNKDRVRILFTHNHNGDIITPTIMWFDTDQVIDCQ